MLAEFSMSVTKVEGFEWMQAGMLQIHRHVRLVYRFLEKGSAEVQKGLVETDLISNEAAYRFAPVVPPILCNCKHL